MRVGFTGTRAGMTGPQFAAFVMSLPAGMTLFRHGCCIGADEEAALHVADMVPIIAVFGHPSDMPAMTSEDALAACADTATPERPIHRNRHIVDGSDMLIASPSGPETMRSGTWSTIRYARKMGKPITICWPNGAVTEEKR